MTLTQENIEKIILDFISKKFLDLEKYVDGLYALEEEADQIYETTREKFKEFTKKHWNELHEIMPFSRNYFCDPLNVLACHTQHLRQFREVDNNYINFCRGQVLITYDDFAEEIGLNKDSVKKYIEILEIKRKICRERGMGGFLYRILGEK